MGKKRPREEGQHPKPPKGSSEPLQASSTGGSQDHTHKKASGSSQKKAKSMTPPPPNPTTIPTPTSQASGLKKRNKKRNKNKHRKKEGRGPLHPQQEEREGGETKTLPPPTRHARPPAIVSTHQSSPANTPQPKRTLSVLQEKFKRKLEGGKFRMLNEMLYTSNGEAALQTFSKDPGLFDVYHQGFREQVSKWPRNPLDDIIAWVKKRPQARVADFGCGDARLAASVSNQVYSFDLVAKNKRVTACDIAHVGGSVDVVVFCLSLMGTNMMDFIKEAMRVLTPQGIIKVAEVRSRFEGAEGGVKAFVKALKELGLECRQMDQSNKMFVMMEFRKGKGKGSQGGRGHTEEEGSGGGKKASKPAPFAAKVGGP